MAKRERPRGRGLRGRGQVWELVMKLWSLVAVAALISIGNASAAKPINWERYVVAETGTSVDIPTSVFTEDAGKPKGAYGKQFLTSDGRANLTVESLDNENGVSPATFLARKNPPKHIVYKRVTPRFFVVSSFRNNKIWYDRCNFAASTISCVLINYPAAEKREWDGIVTRISNTLGKG